MSNLRAAARIETDNIEIEAAGLWQLMSRQRDQPLTEDMVISYRARAADIRRSLDRLDQNLNQMGAPHA